MVHGHVAERSLRRALRLNSERLPIMTAISARLTGRPGPKRPLPMPPVIPAFATRETSA